MAEITYLEAIREALFEEMERDPNVFCIGEDIGAYGGAFKVTDGLMAKYGEQRVIDTPISEIGIVGAAAGAAHMGMRPVVEMQFIDFIANAYDMLTNYVATARYRAFLPCPMVVRGPSGGYVRGGPFHSQNPEAGLHPHAGAQGRLSEHGRGRERADEGGHSRRRLRALLRAQVSVSPHQGRDAGGRSRRADRQGARRARRAPTSRSSPTRPRSTRRSRPRSSSSAKTDSASR